MKAIRVTEFGGPEVLEHADIAQPVPGHDQVLIKIARAGINYFDTSFRKGIFPNTPKPPFTLGAEGAGTIAALGEGVSEFQVGERVAYSSAHGSGGYAEYATVPLAAVVAVPDAIDDSTAAATLLQGLTAHALATSAYPIQSGDTVLVHSAAGGVGLILTQIAKMRGARVIGTTSSADKVALAKEYGADDVITGEGDFVAEVRRLTGGEGVAAVFDAVGKPTFMQGLDCLRRRGHMLVYGASGGTIPPLDIPLLGAKGSLSLTRLNSEDYLTPRAERLRRANELFQWIEEGRLRIHIGHTYPLVDAAHAHRDIGSRITTGKLLLQP